MRDTCSMLLLLALCCCLCVNLSEGFPFMSNSFMRSSPYVEEPWWTDDPPPRRSGQGMNGVRGGNYGSLFGRMLMPSTGHNSRFYSVMHNFDF